MDFALLDFPRPLRELLEEPLPPDAHIPIKKITRYLLVPLRKDDKSGYLALAGFGPTNPEALLAALNELRANADAKPLDNDGYGERFEAVGILRGPNGKNLWVQTIWIKSLFGSMRLITLVSIRPPSP